MAILITSHKSCINRKTLNFLPTSQRLSSLPKDYSKSSVEAKGYDKKLFNYGAANELAKLANRFIQLLKNSKSTASITIFHQTFL